MLQIQQFELHTMETKVDVSWMIVHFLKINFDMFLFIILMELWSENNQSWRSRNES